MGYRSEMMIRNRGLQNNNHIALKKRQPFRVLDGKMLIGKFRGKSVHDIPRSYINWMVKELDLDSSRISYLRRNNLID